MSLTPTSKLGIILTLALLPIVAHAGIPEPGGLYGQIWDDSSGTQVLSGELVITYTPQAGGTAVVVTTPIQEYALASESMSYLVTLPYEFVGSGSTVGAGKLPLSTTPVIYNRTLVVTGTSLIKSDTVTLSLAKRGTLERIDLDEGAQTYHSADYNQDFTFSLRELLLVFGYWNATVTHEYQCGANPDGFAFGAGNTTCRRHSADYLSPAWQFNIEELTEFIADFNESTCHAYIANVAEPDGFGPDSPTCGAGKALSVGKNWSGEPVQVLRRVRGRIEDGAVMLDVMLRVEQGAGDDLMAIGVEDWLPTGWTMSSLPQTPETPNLSPPLGRSDLLEFAWFPVPAISTEFEYTLSVPRGENVAESLMELNGQAIYHLAGEPSGRHVNVGLISPGDLDGDGVSDLIEGTGDFDNDGLPNFIDDDSDDDGLSDADEAGKDDNNNGTPDGYESKAQLPLGAFSSILIVLALGALGGIGARRKAHHGIGH